MKTAQLKRVSSLALVASLTLTSVPAFAQQPAPPPAANDDARQHYERGVKLYEEEDYRTALIEFKRAYELSPNAAVLFNIGQSYYQILDYANALTTFEKYLAEAKDIPGPRKAQVTSEVDELRGRVATVTITTSVPDAEIAVDDVPLGTSPLAQPVRVSAGHRKITAQKLGRQTAVKAIDVAGGDKASVVLELPDAAVATTTPGGTRPVDQSPATHTEPANHTLGYVGLGIAAVGIGVGTVFGVVALGNKSHLDDACKDKTCPNDSQSDIDALSRNATISTIGYAVGIVGVAVAVYGFVAPKSHVVVDSEAPPPKQAGVKLEPMLGLGSAGISGRF